MATPQQMNGGRPSCPLHTPDPNAVCLRWLDGHLSRQGYKVTVGVVNIHDTDWEARALG